MDGTMALAILGAIATVVSAGAAGWANIKQRRTEDLRIGYDALVKAMETYRTMAEDQAARLRDAEANINGLTAKVNRCEADKALQVLAHERERDGLLERIEHLEGRMDDA